jgi:hypothetical protein
MRGTLRRHRVKAVLFGLLLAGGMAIGQGAQAREIVGCGGAGGTIWCLMDDGDIIFCTFDSGCG